jgi:hypothetical protein
LPPALFIGLTVILFRDFIFSDQMLVGNDTLGLGYVARAFYAQALTELGTFPRWAPLILGGTPFLEALSAGDSLYPPSALLLLLLEPYRALGWKLVLHVALAGFFMFGWMRTIGGSRAAALLAGTGYMLAPFFVSLVHPGHDGKMFVTALAPLLFWAVERHFVAPALRTFAATALVIALITYTTHFQMAYFLFGATGTYAIFRSIQLWRETRAGEPGSGPSAMRPAATRFSLFLAASLVGVGIAGVQFFPAADYVTESSRRVQTTREAAGESSVEWSSSWSLHPEEAMSLVIPEFVGANVGAAPWAQDTYWGRNVFKHNSEYVGLILLLLAAVSFVGGARPALRWFLTGLGTVALLFALGANTPVWRLFYEVVPGVRLFRAPSQVIFLFGFAMATLAGLGLDRILRANEDGDARSWTAILRVLFGGTGILALLVLLVSSGALTSAWTGLVYRDVAPAKLQALSTLTPFLIRGAGIALVLGALVSGLTWAFKSGYLAPAGLLAGLVILVAVDEMRVDGPFIQVMDFEAWAAPDAHVQSILQREAGNPEPYRLLSLVQRGQDVQPSLHGIELAAGHHPNDLNRYRELIGMVGSGLPQNLLATNIRRLLNVRYILWPDYDPAFGPAPEGPVVSRLQFQSGDVYTTLLADDGLPRARLVGSAIVKSDEEAVPYMLSPAFDPEMEAVLAEPSPVPLADGPVNGEVTWLERTPNLLRLSVTSEQPALLVVADNWYPAWQATVNDEPTSILRAYHTLRAVPVPAGASTVEMVYRSEPVRRNLWLSLFLFVATVGSVGVQMLWRRSRGREP